MMVDLVGPFPQSGPYTPVLTAMDVFSRYSFTAPFKRVDAETVARALLHILSTHSYIPSKIISDKGTVFVSQTFKQKMTELQIKKEHATVKHPETIGALERCHYSSLKRFLHSQTGKKFPYWHRRLSVATYAYNTTYHTALGTTPTQVFHGKEPIRPLDIRFSGVLRPAQTKSLDPQKNLDNHNELYSQTKQQSVIHFPHYRGYFDRKAKASPLQKGDFCFLLNPKDTKQNNKLAIGEGKWVGFYKVEECLTSQITW